MRKIMTALMAVAVLAGCRSTTKPAAEELKINAKSNYQIVLPDSTPNPAVLGHLRSGAEMVKRALKEGVGCEVGIFPENSKRQNTKSIYIGDTKAARAIGINPAKYPNYAFVVEEKDGDIYIVGADGHRYGDNKKIRAGAYDCILGSFNGTIRFAEKYLGTRFLYPGKYGEDLAQNVGEFKIPTNLKWEVRPQLIFSCGRFLEPFYSYSNNAYGSGAFKTYGGHSYYDAVPAKVYGQKHPEYFALSGGKRNPVGNHLCISNPEVQELIYKEMLKHLDAGAETVQLAQTDGYKPCECDKCKAFGNTDDPGEKLWILHRALAERLMKERPGKNAHIISYGPTRNPPKSFSEFPPNVIIELCSYSPADFDAWKKIKVPGGFTTYIYNWGCYKKTGYTPKRTPDFCAEQVKLFSENNVRGVYRCGFGENMGLEGPTYYVYGKLFENPDQSPEALTDDFYRRAYHEAYAPMRVFHETLNERLAIHSRLEGLKSTEGGMKHVSVLPNNPRVLITAIYSPDVLDVMEKNLSRAEKLAEKNPTVKKRLELVRAEFTYVKNLAETLHMYNAYRLNPTKDNFEQLAKFVEARQALIASYFDAKGRKKNIPDWPEARYFDTAPRNMLDVNGRLSAPIGAPLNWNIKLLREKGILPGVGKKTLQVVPAKGAVSDSDFTSGAWAAAKWNELNGIQLGSTQAQTRFKVIYDAKNVYFGVETDLPAERNYTACGKDGSCWGQDCLELIVDPTGTRDIYYHFILNPVANSSYDAAFGLIKDVLDPRYNSADPGWDGKWDYKSTRKGNKWNALITIPYQTLGVKAPGPGTIWLLNLGREDFLKPKSNPELSLWSPNLETMSFHDRDTLGEMIFE